MASCNLAGAKTLLVATLVLVSMAPLSLGARRLTELYQPPLGDQLSYHGGDVLRGDIAVSIVWYGHFTPVQKSIVADFILSLTSTPQAATPSVAQWWGTIDHVYLSNAAASGPTATRILLADQVSDEQYSLGKSLTLVKISQLAASTRPKKGAIVLVLTDPDVLVEGFCSSRCGLHGSDEIAGYTYAWVGNAKTQCAGQCAWPFAKPSYGPQGEPLGAPNGDVGIDGILMTLASTMAGAATNPFGDGYYQGAKEAPLEACTACPGVYGRGAYPGYAGKVLFDATTGGSYNANGANGRKYLLPAIFNPAMFTCSTLV